MKKHLRQVHSEKKHACTDCPKQFSSKFVLQRHKSQVHSADRNYACEFCNKTFSKLEKKTNHEISRHMNIRLLHKCEICDKKFYCKRILDRHVQVKHNRIFFQCPICEKPFKKEETMLLHCESHNPDYKKPQFPCDICGNVLSTLNSHKKHRRAHVTPKSSIICNVCGKTILRDNFTIHLRRHTGEKPFRCDLCPAAFVRSSLLTEHMRTHTNEKPYECCHCQKRFMVKTALNSHLLVHKGIKPFQCGVCLRKFYHKGQLRLHRCKGPSL